MKFKYKGQQKTGIIVEGVADAPDKFALARQFRDQDITIISAVEFKTGFSMEIKFLSSIFDRITIHEKIVFLRNLSGMLSAGLTLFRALGVLERQTTNAAFRKVITSLMEEINRGGTLSDGMHNSPRVFPMLFVSMVRAGEESGTLSQTMKEISNHLEKTYLLNKKIKSAMTYPAIIMSAVVLIGILMLTFVVPTLTKTFKEMNVALPASTQFIIWISDFLSQHFFAAIFTLLGIVIGAIYLARLPIVMRILDIVILKIPVVGPLAKEVNASRTARTLSSLLNAGVDMSRSILITKDVLQNSLYKKVLDDASHAIEKGIPLSSVFKDNPKLYPIMVGEMIEVGEETGALSKMLLDIATFYEEDVDTKTKDLSTIVEPVLMIMIGGAVGFFAVSMISPMYSLLDNIQ
ncbi:MAG: type II secretion system F family protein [Candidatus Paceibacterota bacterium]|jgi:type IV pilus assembly protein PilC